MVHRGCLTSLNFSGQNGTKIWPLGGCQQYHNLSTFGRLSILQLQMRILNGEKGGEKFKYCNIRIVK